MDFAIKNKLNVATSLYGVHIIDYEDGKINSFCLIFKCDILWITSF